MNRLEQLEQQRLIWRGRHAQRPLQPRASGWPELDHQLGGLPRSGVIAVHTAPGIGELRLLWPSVATDERLGVLINPPFQIGSEGWQGAGLALERWLNVSPASCRDGLWATEQSLKSGACASVWFWPGQRLRPVEARRLQLAATSGQARLFLFLPESGSTSNLPVELHLRLQPHPQGIRVAVPKRKQGWALPPFVVTMAERWPELAGALERSELNPVHFSGARAI